LEKYITYCVVALAITLPAWLYPVLLAQLACMALFACSLNLLFGYAGLLSFGHAAFFGIAAYTTGYLTKVMGFTPELAILCALAVVMLVAYIFG
jgi:branched-chain amino acid transport system permease protein